jgi:4-amino-4-deoxy-L-arabinose transferase-like glycosyltransferase
MQKFRHFNTAVVAILLLAFGLRLTAAVWWQERQPAGSEFAFGDSHSYWNLGRVIAEGKPYEYAKSRVFRTPGYPLLLSTLFRFNEQPPVTWARALGAVLGVAAVGGVICLTGQMFDRRAALLAGLLTAVYPGAVGMSVFILSEAPFCPFMMAQLICWTAASDRVAPLGRWLTFAGLGGCASGLANLVRPSWILFTPMIALLALLFVRSQRRHLIIAIVMLLTTSITMAPWWIRNYQVTGAFVPTTLEIGASLYDGLNPRANGDSDMWFVDEFRTRHEQGHGETVYEIRLSQAMRDAAIDWARHNPGRVLELAGDKFLRMWSPWPNAEELQSATFRWLTMAGYLPLLLAGIWGGVRYFSRGFTIWICLLPAVYFTGLHVIFVSSIRYRQPAMLPLIVLAAAAVTGVCCREPEQESSAANDRNIERQKKLRTE